MDEKVYTVKFNGRTYSFQHGDAFDRGWSDNYYGRERNPHKGHPGAVIGIRTTDLTDAEREEYNAGYDYNKSLGLFDKRKGNPYVSTDK